MIRIISYFRIVTAIIFLGGCIDHLFAEEKPENESRNIPFTFKSMFVSNYVDRGSDVFALYAQQKGKSYGNATGAWAFQPELQIGTPVEGLYLNIRTSHAIEGRKDKDHDQIIQRHKSWHPVEGYMDIVLQNEGAKSLPEIIGNDIKAQFSDPANPYFSVPWFKAERNGLQRLDELEITFGYGFVSQYGFIEFGMVSPTYPNAKDEEVARRPDHELFITYSPVFLRDFSVTLNVDFHQSNEYWELNYSRPFEIGNFTITPGILSGYAVKESYNGMIHTDGYVLFGWKGFELGFHTSHRNDLSYYAEGRREQFPVAIIGETHLREGKVKDPAQTYGFFRSIFNQAVEDELRKYLPEEIRDHYHYIPRQRLPRWLNWVSVSYTQEF